MNFCIVTIKRKQFLGNCGLLQLDFVSNARAILEIIGEERSNRALGDPKCEYQRHVSGWNPPQMWAVSWCCSVIAPLLAVKKNYCQCSQVVWTDLTKSAGRDHGAESVTLASRGAWFGLFQWCVCSLISNSRWEIISPEMSSIGEWKSGKLDETNIKMWNWCWSWMSRKALS